MKKIAIKRNSAKQMKRGFPLVQEKDLVTDSDSVKISTGWVKFVDEQGTYLATGYLGKQNKGIGWTLSRNEQETINLDFFLKRFEEAKQRRVPLLASKKTTAFRVFNGEGDGVGGVTLDWYAGYLVVSWYNHTLYQYQEMIYEAIKEAYPEMQGIYEKIRYKETQLPETRHVAGKKTPENFTILENGVRYAVYLNEGLMTGIFLDQREVRGKIKDSLARGKRVLNTFSYTGAFSVAAAVGGARQTVSVDLAKRSKEKTTEQFEVNQLELDCNQIVVMDVFDYFRYAKRKELCFDLIILDPPSFARNKKKNFSTIKNYGDLVEDALLILAEEGTLIASCNTANLSMDKYKKMVLDVLQKRNYQYQMEEVYQLPPDFTVKSEFSEGNYLKVLVIRVKKMK